MIGRRAVLAAFGFAACTPGPAFAQAPAADAAAATAAVAADRMQMLVDGAKREGTLSLYASAPPDDLAAVTSAFESRPGSYEDLLDPKWKGRLGLEADDFDWFAAVVKELGEARGLALFRNIAAGNGLSLRKGHTLLANLVVSGEVPLALNVYQYKAAQLKNDGAPIDWLVIAPAIARFQGAGIARRAPHPHAAVLFLDFLLSDAQNLAMRRDYAPSNERVTAQYGGVPVTVVDPALVLDESNKWSKLYRDIALGK
jgi:Bacterial extracellular solute-binding protein